MILVLDLDDTLYEEMTFVISGFRSVAKLISSFSKHSTESLFGWMMSDLEQNGRGKTFDNLLKNLNLYSEDLLHDCLSLYQTHNPNIRLFDESFHLLNKYSTTPKYLVTDGNPIVQNSKITALNIRQEFKGIYTTWSLGLKWHKPSILSFVDIARREGVFLKEICYVADDPNKDFVGLNQVGATTVRVLTGRFKHLRLSSEYEAIHQINNLSEFDL